MSKAKKPYKLHTYSTDALEQALEQVHNGLSIAKAAAEYGIPKSTLHTKFTGKVAVISKRGPPSILTVSEEERLEKWILNKAKLGFPMHPEEVKNAVQTVLKEAPRATPFVDQKPGEKWFQLFMKRHPDIAVKQSELISKGRAAVTEEKLRSWYQGVKDHLEEIGASSVLDRPQSIFNGDEVGMELCPQSGKLLGKRGEKNCYEIASGKEKENITVLCSFSANGVAAPPMIMFPYKMPSYLSDLIPDDWGLGKSDSGWMVSSAFYEYFTSVFHPWCIKTGVEFPIIYFFDGHKSHLTLELSDFCVKNNIILYCLYPNSTHITQPCDVAVFKALKCKWKQVVLEYKQKTQKSLTKATFIPLFREAFLQITESTIKNGFKACGLYPFDENAVNYSKCISTRRKGINQDNVEIAGSSQLRENDVLTRDDFLSTAKFFEHFLEAETIQEFQSHRHSNGLNDNLVYLLWSKCMDGLQDISPDSNFSTNLDHQKLRREEGSLTAPSSVEKVIDVPVQEGQGLHNSSETPVVPFVLLTNDSAIVNENSVELDDTIIIECDEDLLAPAYRDNTADFNNFNEIDTTLLLDKAIDLSESNINTSCKINIGEDIDSQKNDSNSKHEILTSNSQELNNNDTEFKVLSRVISTPDAITGEKNEESRHSIGSSIVETSSAPNSDISTIWDKNLTWPTPEDTKKIKKTKDPLPCAITGAKWREIHMKMKAEKEEKEMVRKQKTLERQIKKEENEKKKFDQKLEREKKQEEKARVKEEKEAKKQLIKLQKLQVATEKLNDRPIGKSRAKKEKREQEK